VATIKLLENGVFRATVGLELGCLELLFISNKYEGRVSFHKPTPVSSTVVGTSTQFPLLKIVMQPQQFFLNKNPMRTIED
jgi:hypothetical protein